MIYLGLELVKNLTTSLRHGGRLAGHGNGDRLVLAHAAADARARRIADELENRLFLAKGITLGVLKLVVVNGKHLSGIRTEENSRHLSGNRWLDGRCGPGSLLGLGSNATLLIRLREGWECLVVRRHGLLNLMIFRSVHGQLPK